MKYKLMVSLLFLILLSCAGQAQSSESIVFAVDPTKPPMQFIDDKGIIAGFEIDLLKEMGRQAGFTPVFKRVSWQGIFEGLEKNKYDAVCASVSITDARKDSMVFTIPYYKVTQAVLTLAGAEIKKPGDLRGKKIGVKKETTSLQTIQNIPGVNSIAFDTVLEAVDALRAKTIDGVICDGPVAGHYTLSEKEAGLKIALVFEQEKIELYGIAIKKDNKGLRNQLNTALEAVQKENMDISLQKKWFSGLLEGR